MSHRGRGPKGYSRSDDRIREDVSDRLSDDHMIDASDIEIEVKGGKKAIVIFVPMPQLKAFHKIQQR